MNICPKCGFKFKQGNFCPECGFKFNSELKSLRINDVIIISIIVLFVISLVSIGYLFISGTFQNQSNLKFELMIPENSCVNDFSYSVELKNSNNEPLVNQPISIFVNDVLYEKLYTDINGRFSYKKQLPSEWCGKTLNFSVVYFGDFLNKPSSQNLISNIFVPTELTITIPAEIIANEEINLTIFLKDYLNNPLSNKKVFISNINNDLFTNSEGIILKNIILNNSGKNYIFVRFNGDSVYNSSESKIEFNVIPQMCEDFTIVGECSKSLGYFCNINKTLIFECSICGCPSDLVCYNKECITKEAQNLQLISSLQENIVFIKHSYATGSGVIFSQNNNNTIILTNRHVVEGASTVGDLIIYTNEGVSAIANSIRVAPNDMDLAIIYLIGKYGNSVSYDYNETYKIGQEVLALGSPRGIQGSVSYGIISNFVNHETDSKYEYTAIQTDAAINPGNSGGGLFSKISGNLIGINTFIISDSEGLNYAIDLKELQKMSNYDNWKYFVPSPKCSDGTPYGYCSMYDIGYACLNGVLIESCIECGCPYEYPYCDESGVSSGQCFSCYPGYEGYSDGYCCRTGWDYYGNGICCPPGYEAYEDGTCCAPGYEWATEGQCCPEGTHYESDGYCHY